jgi:ABC-type multidrug transport system ATPase subunit
MNHGPDQEKTAQVLVASGLCKRLGGRRLLSDLELSCGEGEIVAILGENGTGKSTLLRLLSGILAPDGGKVRLLGRDVLSGDAAARRDLGYAPDGATPLPELSALELLRLCAALKGAPPPDEALCERLGASGFLPQRLATLSLGQRRRVGILLALLGDPALLLLDEPSSGLDPDGIDTLAALLVERAQAGKAAIVTSNDLSFVARLPCRRLRLSGGRLLPP